MTSLDAFASASSDSTPKGWEAGVEIGATDGTITSGPVTEKIRDWPDLLRIWDLDPEAFDVIEPVTFKAWDGYAKDAVTQEMMSKRLYSYKARIVRRSPLAIDPALLADWTKTLQKPTAAPRHSTGGGRGTYAAFVADPQLGKKGTQEAVDNWKEGVRQHCNEISRLLARHEGPANILVSFMGDEHEQVCNSYTNQPATVELNFSQQIELDFSLRTWTIKEFAKFGLPVEVTSVISNHGEWTRNGSKDPVTSKADNSSTSVMRLVRSLVQETRISDLVDFTIADSNPDIVLETSGVKMVLSHGHIAKGRGSSSEQRVKNAIERQILGRTEEIGDAALYVTAHYHHFHCQEFEGRTLFGCPALEAERSSEYMLEQYGVWSPPGMLGFLVSDYFPRGWHSLNIF